MSFWLNGMEVSFVKEPEIRGNESIRFCDTHDSLMQLRSTEQVAAIDELGANNCEHFTIRGYVAEIRKRDAKICWPLFLHHKQAWDEHANSPPPMCVTKYRWWCCKSCLHKLTSEASAANGALYDVQNDEVEINSTSFPINADATRLSSGIQQPSREKILGKRSREADYSINVRNHRSCSALCCGKRETESVIKNLFDKGCHDRPQDNQDQSTEPAIFATEGTSCQEGKGGRKRNKAVTATKIENAIFSEDVSFGSADAKLSDEVPAFESISVAASVHRDNQRLCAAEKVMKLCDNVAKEYLMPQGADTSSIPKHEALNANAAHIFDHDLRASGSSNYKATKRQVHLHDDMNKCQNHTKKVTSANEKLRQKKAYRVRFLDDIIRSEELQMTDKAHIASGDAEANQTVDDNTGIPDPSKRNAQHSNCKIHLVTKIPQAKATADTIGLDHPHNEDEGSSLMHWLKKLPKKASAYKTYAKTKHNETASSICTVPSSEQDLNPNLERSEVRRRKAKRIMEKENRMPQVLPCLMPQQEILFVKSDLTKQSPANAVHPISTERVMLQKNPHQGPDIQDHIHGKIILSNKRKKACQLDDRESLRLQKNSSQIHKSKVQKKVMKKQKATKTCKQEVIDDFPMDIVELLAKNQHERCLMTAEAAEDNMHNLSVMAESMKDGTDSNVGRSHESKVLDAANNNLPNNRGPNIHSTATTPANANGRIDACDSANHAKPNSLIDQNQQAVESLAQKVGEKAAEKACHQELINLSKSQLLSKEEKVGLSTNRRILVAASSNAEAGKEHHYEIMRQPDLCSNETISALHLLQLMGSAAWPGSSLNANHVEVNQKSFVHCNYQNRQSFGLEVGIRDRHPDQDHQKWKSCKIHRPVPRIGVLGSLLHEEIMCHSSNCRKPLGLRGRLSNEVPLLSINGSEKTSKPLPSTDAEVRDTRIAMDINPNQIASVGSLAHSGRSPAKDTFCEVGTSNNNGAVYPPKGSCKIENCIVNKNPADFTTPDEENGYMIGNIDLQSSYTPPSKSLHCKTHPDGQRQHKVRKLTALMKSF